MNVTKGKVRLKMAVGFGLTTLPEIRLPSPVDRDDRRLQQAVKTRATTVIASADRVRSPSADTPMPPTISGGAARLPAVPTDRSDVDERQDRFEARSHSVIDEL